MSQFESMSLQELESAQKEITNLIQIRRAEAKDELLAEFKAKADKLGIDMNELIGTKKPKLAPKYQNPEKKSEVWTGRGQQPKWLKAKIKSGANLEDFKL